MKTSNLILTVLLIIAVAVLATAQQKPAANKSREVKVFFYHDPGEYIDISAVKRSVSATAPARAAIQALLNGPTARERNDGFESLIGPAHFRIGSLSINDGTARINFVSRKSWLGWGGDLAPVRFKKAVELTLQQFPTVKTVIVSLNGDPKFAEES